MKNAEVLFDLPEDEYHALPRMSASWIRNATDLSPAHADELKQITPSEAMVNGSLFHLLVLEPERFEEKVVSPPNVEFRSKDGKANACAWVELKTGKELPKECQNKAGFVSFLAQCGFYVCTDSQLENLRCAKAALEGHERFNEVWQPQESLGSNEVSILFWLSGVPCKARIDRLSPAGLIDLKSTRCASPREFPRNFCSMRYHIQAAMYQKACELAGMEMSDVFYVPVELKKPYGLGFYCIQDEILRLGLDQVYLGAELWKSHTKEEPLSYKQEIVRIDAPHWLKEREGIRNTETMPLVGEEM